VCVCVVVTDAVKAQIESHWITEHKKVDLQDSEGKM